MPLYKQGADISPLPITYQIGGGSFASPIPALAIVPSWNIQLENTILQSTGTWVQELNYFGNIGAGATTLSFPDIEGTIGNFLALLPLSATTVSAEKLRYVGANVISGSPQTYTNLTSVSFPELIYAGFLLSNSTTHSLTTLNLPKLVWANNLSITANSLTSASFPELKYSLTLSITSTGVTSLSIPKFVAGTIAINCPALTGITLPPLGTFKNCLSFTSVGNQFNQTAVENILATFASMDGTNGTSLFGTGRVCSITGNSSAPSNAGSTTTAGSNFSGVGTTCTVNFTGHGYSTGDVIRVSGLTGLTNANRYAVITVTSANQFTYSINSQTATGAGTATIIKANDSAKAIVTRGATLTTN